MTFRSIRQKDWASTKAAYGFLSNAQVKRRCDSGGALLANRPLGTAPPGMAHEASWLQQGIPHRGHFARVSRGPTSSLIQPRSSDVRRQLLFAAYCLTRKCYRSGNCRVGRLWRPAFPDLRKGSWRGSEARSPGTRFLKLD
jgi:hypothetical protein